MTHRTTADFAKTSGWRIDESSSHTVRVGDIIVVTPQTSDTADVAIVRDGRRIEGADGRIDAHGDLVAQIGAFFLFLSVVRGILFFRFNDNQGPSPDGGGSSGGPGGGNG